MLLLVSLFLSLFKGMKLIEKKSLDGEPEWDGFSINTMNFRPNWDGDLVNVLTTIRPEEDVDKTEEFTIFCAKSLAKWVIDERGRFGVCDRFQIIVGWAKDVRETGRQIVKVGGGFDELEDITSGRTNVLMRKGWDVAVF